MANPSRSPSAHVREAGAALALCSACGGAAAQSEAVVWQCGLERHVQLVCALRQAPPVRPTAADLEALQSRAPGLPVRRLSPASAQVVEMIALRPGALAGRKVVVPLWGEASDAGFVRELAEAVMCGSAAACAVEFSTALRPGRPAP